MGIPRKLLDDDRLSFRAAGLAAYILGKPDDWRVNGRHLATTHTEGRDAVHTALAELEQAGYLVRRRYQDPITGRWWTESVLYESPEAALEEATEPAPPPKPDSQDSDTQDPADRDSARQDSSLSPKRDTPKPPRHRAANDDIPRPRPGPFVPPQPAEPIPDHTEALTLLDQLRSTLEPQEAAS